MVISNTNTLEIKECTYEVGDFSIEITEPTKVKDGIQVFARAFKKGLAVGFGSDATIEWERFIFINPPTLAVDFLQKALANTIQITYKDGSKIISGKRGNTTTTFFPSLDGNVSYHAGPPYHTWATVRASAGNGHTTGNYADNAVHGNGVDSWEGIDRSILLFDTSSLGAVTISAATLNFVSDGKFNQNITTADDISPNVVSSNPASTSVLADADYGTLGSTSFGRIAFSSVVTDSATYNPISLNASGISAINTSGISKFGLKMDADFSDTSPSASSTPEGGANRVDMFFSVTGGTSQDPTLIVTYSAASKGNFLAFM